MLKWLAVGEYFKDIVIQGVTFVNSINHWEGLLYSVHKQNINLLPFLKIDFIPKTLHCVHILNQEHVT